MLDEAALLGHLDALGWRAQAHGERTWRVVHETTEGELRVFVRLSDEWMIASIVPFLRTRGGNSFDLCRWLLRQNRDMEQTKFGIDEDGDVVLSVEVPTESLDRFEVRVALESLVRHGARLRTILRAASEAARTEDNSSGPEAAS
jgi:hypothetical protein